MTTKRTPISRHRKRVTPEMVELFARGLRILKFGCERSREYIDIVKALDWAHLGPHAVSVFDPVLDGPMPGYMTRLASGRARHPPVPLRRALMEELEPR